MQTVIGAFDHATAAQRALDRLVEAGIDRNDVHLEPGDGASTGTSGSTGTATARSGEHEGVMGSIGHFFSNLFSSNTDSGYAGTYSEAVRRGSTVVVVDADDDTQAEQAAAILHDCGAVDVDERAEEWRSTGWTGSSPGLGGERDGASSSQPLTGQGYAAGQDKTIGQGFTAAPDPSSADTAPQREATMGQDLTGRDAQSRAGLRDETMPKVVEEELQVGRRTVDRGGVRVFERVTEKPVLAKTARGLEEVTVGKDVQQRDETVSDTVRRKDFEVERVEGLTGSAREHAAASDRATGGSVSRDPLGRDTLGRERDRDAIPKTPGDKG